MTIRAIVPCLAMVVLLFCSCAKEEDSQGGRHADATRTPVTEEYEEVSASDGLIFAVMDFSGAQEIGEGGVRIPGGTFGQLLCNGKAVPVANSRLEAGFITTRDYGKIKVAISLFGELTVYLTPTQKKQFAQFK
jgi:hypothetical protein